MRVTRKGYALLFIYIPIYSPSQKCNSYSLGKFRVRRPRVIMYVGPLRARDESLRENKFGCPSKFAKDGNGASHMCFPVKKIVSVLC